MKERLLGAAVLIAAAILIIPAFLDGPQRPETTSSELALPVPGGNESGSDNSRTHTVEIDTGRSTSQDNAISAAGSPSPAQAVSQAVQQAQTATAEPTKPATAPVIEPVAAQPVKKPLASDAGWAVQVGSFTSESNARRLMEHLKDAGYPAFVVRNVVNGRVMFRVRVGPESDRLHAEALIERLKADRQQTQLVRHP